jgi:hypothetical protein
MTASARRATEISVELPAGEAMELFTPEGERRWVDGWDPRYPEAQRREGTGAVFTTEHAGHQTTWIMVDHTPAMVRYARVTEGVTAGTVSVEVVASDERSTQVLVTYDLTALTAAGERWLEAFVADYESAIGGWSTAIAAALQRQGAPSG